MSRAHQIYGIRTELVEFTASRMKSICRTDHSKPARSLLNAICYPEAYRFKTKAIQWGCKHEKLAREYYTKVLQEEHDDATVKISGLVLKVCTEFRVTSQNLLSSRYIMCTTDLSSKVKEKSQKVLVLPQINPSKIANYCARTRL